MLEKINLLAEANRVDRLYVYEKVGKLNGHTLSVVNTFDSFTGRGSRKPSGEYSFKSESMCQIAVSYFRMFFRTQ